jgi:hypothetical protein
MPRTNNSTSRQFRKADRLLQTGFFVMRPYSYCTSRRFLYVLSSESPYYKRYFRINRQCELAPADTEIERLHKQLKKFFNGAREALDRLKKARAKAVRLAKQRRIILKRLRDLSDRENQNILKLEINEMVELESFLAEDMGKVISSKALNSFSPRTFSFLNPALLGSLGFPNKIPAEPLSN